MESQECKGYNECMCVHVPDVFVFTCMICLCLQTLLLLQLLILWVWHPKYLTSVHNLSVDDKRRYFEECW